MKLQADPIDFHVNVILYGRESIFQEDGRIVMAQCTYMQKAVKSLLFCPLNNKFRSIVPYDLEVEFVSNVYTDGDLANAAVAEIS